MTINAPSHSTSIFHSMRIRFVIPIVLFTSLMTAFQLPAMNELEFNALLKSNQERAVALLNEAQKNQERQPEFADWLKCQQEIFQSFDKSAKFDFKYQPDRLKRTLRDWETLLGRMEIETSYYATQLDPVTTGRIDVRELGAKADGITDDAPVIRRAIEMASKGPKRAVFLPAGRYRISPMQEDKYNYFLLSDLKDVTLLGENGTVLVTDNPYGGLFTLRNCENVRLEGFHRTTAKPFFSTGLITAVKEPNILEVLVDGGLPPTDQLFLETDGGKNGGLIRIVSGRMEADGQTPKVYSSHSRIPPYWDGVGVKHLQGDVYEFTLRKLGSEAIGQYRTGERLIYFYRDRERTNPAFAFYRSKHCRLKDISMDSHAGLTIFPWESDATFVTGFQTEASKDSKIALATTADAWFGRAGSLGGYVADSQFKNHGDDFINIFTGCVPIIAQQGNVIFLPDNYSDEQLALLKEIDVIRFSKGQSFINKTYFVKSATKVAKQKESSPGSLNGQETVTLIRVEVESLSEDLATAAPYQTLGDYQSSSEGQGKNVDMVHLPDFGGLGQVFTRCKFENGVSRVLNLGSGAVIMDSHFRNRLPIYHFITGSTNDFINGGMEAYYQRYITIKNNTIDSVDTRIFNMADTKFDIDRPETRAAHLFFTGNQIHFAPFPLEENQGLFWARGCDDVVISDNYVTSSGIRGPLYQMEHSRVLLKGNEVEGQFSPSKIEKSSLLLPDSSL